MDLQILSNIIFATITTAIPLILAALGNLINEKSGILNLGTEGMMAVGAVVGFIATYKTGNPWIGVFAGFGAGMLISSIHAFLTITLLTNQVASGLALSIFGIGFSAFIGKDYESLTLPPVDVTAIPLLSKLPIIGHGFFEHQFIVYLSWIFVGAVLWFLYKTRTGLVLRAIGESPTSAHAIGYPVNRYRYAATIFGGGMAGIGGTYLSVFSTPLWVEGMVAGRGWIALALVVFATWKPVRVVIGAYLFAGVMIIQFFVQGSGLQIQIPSQLLSSLPYLATIVVLVLISRNKTTLRLNTPVSLGKPFSPDS